MPGIQKITIEQQLAEIGLHSTPAQMHISRPQMQMSISNERPEMDIERKAPTFRVNRRKINSESGLKATPELSKDFRDKGRVGALRGSRTAKEDGNFLGELRQPGDRVAKLARNKTMSRMLDKKEINIGLMPQSSPEVVWDTGHLRINWSRHSIVIDWDGEYMPQVTIDPKYSIEIYLRTEPYLRVNVESAGSLGSTGRYVDRAI